ncbi:MAG: hypothetical protein ACI9F9_003408, partial [Candidatus Paceibacteria bacterium]
MARFRHRAGDSAASVERQLSLFDRLDTFTRSQVERVDPRTPAAKLFCVVLALMGLGLL